MQNALPAPQGTDLRAYAEQAWARAQKSHEQRRERNAARIRRARESLDRLQRTIEQGKAEARDASPDPPASQN